MEETHASKKLHIGVLALQGDFEAHLKMLAELGVEGKAVRLPKHLQDLDGIIVPGGESTTIGKLMVLYGLAEPLQQQIQEGFPVWGTCAGLILLARETDKALIGQPLLATMHIRVRRNAFGSQRESFETDLSVPVLGEADSTNCSCEVQQLIPLARRWRCWQRSTMTPPLRSARGPYSEKHYTRRC